MRWGILHREFFERSKTGVGVVSELFLRVSESTSFVVASFRVLTLLAFLNRVFAPPHRNLKGGRWFQKFGTNDGKHGECFSWFWNPPNPFKILIMLTVYMGVKLARERESPWKGYVA
ncbi:uncharacterized protein YALI1_E24713g [Yarrowia lipolytica]|uniref:Uncharacterized protein n=1 Tax=Yarrowia lipolytica TaxID=4952 RepID=A0A1D8NJB5_YARLL|nr:hypothetical protein YALI1_E24713g [Yarrowia lipolytica]